MRGGSGAGLGAQFRRPAGSTKYHVLCCGQSLGVGFGQNSVSTTQPFNNVMMHDSSGVYDITQPHSSTLSWSQPLISPPRSGITANPYPNNINGTENPDVAFSNQLTALFRSWHYDDFVVASTNVANGGAPLSVINQGTNDYNAGLYEARALKWLNPGGFGNTSCLPLAILLAHGEADATAFNAAYGSQLEATLRAAYMTDWLGGVFGLSGSVPMILSQQNSSPGNLMGPNLTAAAMLNLAQANPGLYLMTGPKYIWPSPGDFLHLSEYRAFAEKSAECLFRWMMLGQIMTLWPVGVSRSGNVVTLTFHCACPPLAFDTSIAAPHLSGMWSMWANGQGFEFGDNPLTLSTISGNGVSPIALGFTTPHNYGVNGTQVTIAVQGVIGNTNANGVFTATVTGPSAVTLNGTTGNGAGSLGYTGGPTVFTPIAITSPPTIVNPMSFTPQVQITLARPPVTGGFVAYAEQSDCAYGANTQSVGQGRWGTLRDSDPFRGRSFAPNFFPASYYYNWCVEFTLPVS